MKIYRGSLKNTVTVGIVLAVIVSFFIYFKATLSELMMISWVLTMGEQRQICTLEDRMAYLKDHPKEIKIAMVGNWATDNNAGRPRQKVLGLAIRRINDAGGINGRQIVPDWLDISDSIDTLMEHVEKIAYDPSYYAILGPSSSGQLTAIKPLLLKYRLLTISPRLSNTRLSQPQEPPCIFLPNSSDVQDVLTLRKWAEDGKRDNFLLINESHIFAEGYTKHVERLFFESNAEIIARTHFNATDNLRYGLEELDKYFNYFHIKNALVVNFISAPEKYEQLTRWLLANIPGDIFSHKVLPGKYTDAETKRMYTIVYYDGREMLEKHVLALANIPNVHTDVYAPIDYRSVFLFADACKKAKSLHQDDVIAVMCSQPLETPFGTFQFNSSRFEADPIIRVISVYNQRKAWNDLLQQARTKGNSEEKRPRVKKNDQ